MTSLALRQEVCKNGCCGAAGSVTSTDNLSRSTEEPSGFGNIDEGIQLAADSEP